jgi:hypothetical protein
MKKILETEILGFVTRDQYEEMKEKLTKELGAKKTLKRLSLQIMDYKDNTIDTRIRITNGKAEIMQKYGDWKSETREEIDLPLPGNPQDIFKAWRIIYNLYEKESRIATIIQTNSITLVFDDKFEIKLTHQFGKEDRYSYEVESLNDNLDPREAINLLGLPVDNSVKDSAFWKDFNNAVNIDALDIDFTEIESIISNYLISN